MGKYWIVIRKGPGHSNPSRYAKQILNEYGIYSNEGKILFDTQQDINNQQYLAALLARHAKHRGNETDIGPVIIHSYTDEDGYPGVIVTANVTSKEYSTVPAMPKQA